MNSLPISNKWSPTSTSYNGRSAGSLLHWKICIMGCYLTTHFRSRVPQEFQVTILRWVTHSSRPLRLLELAAMLDSLNNEKKGKDAKSIVRAACGPLLEILEDETVSVIHHSFTEFLTDSSRERRKAPGSVHPQFPVISPPTTHRCLAVTCLRYLTSGCLSNWALEPRREDGEDYNHCVVTHQSIHLQQPFLGYAVSSWYFHIEKMGEIDQRLCSILDTFMQVGNHDFKAWLDLVGRGPIFEKTLPLHVAAWAGLTGYARHLLQLGNDCNAPDAQQRTPLSWAAEKGHTEIVALLLENGSEADPGDSAGWKPLHYAAWANHHAVVKLLLDAGVSPLTQLMGGYSGPRHGNVPATTGHTPLIYACQSGNVETVREMMPYLKAANLNSSLCTAAKCGKSQLVDLLLTSPDISVDPLDAVDTPLFLASAGLHLEIMRSLLKKGADPMRRSQNHGTRMPWLSLSDLSKEKDSGPTPFHAICGASKDRRYGQGPSDEDVLRKCFRLLSEAGCDINATDGQGKTPLHYSVAQGSLSKPNNVLSTLLLESGADPTVRDKEGNTPFHLVQLSEDSAPTVEALLSHGADITARRPRDDRTPLHSMVESIYSLNLKALLPHVTDWNVQDAEGNTPLHIMLAKSREPNKVLGDFLEAGADLSVKNKIGEVPLHVMRDILNSGKNVVPLLLEAGADLEAKDNEGRTVLMRKMIGISESHSTVAILEVLLGYGSKVDTRDNKGNGVLHAVCKKSADTKLLRRLVDAGADPHCVNNAGNTLFHEVTKFYMLHEDDRLEETIDLLLELGISPNTRNHLGQTPLHFVYSTPLANFLASNKNPIDTFTAPPFANLIDTPDNNGVLPIHLAATISEELVSRLIDAGASSTVITHEGRSILHIAARARQSNIVGLILEHWTAIQRLDVVDHPDSRGRTALHDACRSGRPESVALLLKASADPSFEDKNRYTPLHVCAEFEEENKLWASAVQGRSHRFTRASGVLLSDTSRPQSLESFYLDQREQSGMWSKISIENNTTRVLDIIRLLVCYGADVDALANDNSFAIDLALKNGCEEMTNELLPALEKVYAKAAEEESHWSWRGHRQRNPFHETYITLRSKHLPDVLETEMKGEGNQKIHRCHELLALREFNAIEQLPGMGLDFTPKVREPSGDFLTTLTK